MLPTFGYAKFGDILIPIALLTSGNGVTLQFYTVQDVTDIPQNIL